jgi:hypothetical protein
VRLSIGGQPWPELELHGRPWGARRRGRGGERGRGEEQGDTTGRVGGGGAMGVAALGRVASRPCWAALFVQTVACCAVREKRRKERRKRK